MAFKNQDFHRSGPRGLTCIDWKNADHVRSVVASLVQVVYVLEGDHQGRGEAGDRQGRGEGSQALAPPWWETLGFQLERRLKDEADRSIFGAIFKYEPLPSSSSHSADGPRFVVAFRGTLIKEESFVEDIKLDVQLIRNKLHSSSRCKAAVQAVEDSVTAAGNSKVVWLAGHSLGSAIALQAGKHMAKKGLYLESFLFNPPYASVLIKEIRSKMDRACWFGKSGLSLGLALAKQSPEQRKQFANSFKALSPWVPHLFVNKVDKICSGYIGYFEHGKWMRKHKLDSMHDIASRYSVTLLLLCENGTQVEPLHLIPSANLTINSKPPESLLRAHGICEWCELDLELKSEVYKY